MTQSAPEQKKRIQSLDFIRGIAILGMLVPNIPWHAGNSMSRVYDADLSSTLAWLAQYLIFDQRFMPLFCMLFGASIYLLAGSDGLTPKFNRYFLRRMSILLFFGVLHAYLLWPGDILITYAICGPLLLLFFRSPIWLLLTAGILFKGVDLLFGEWPQLYSATIERLLFSWWVDYGDAPSSAAAAYAGSYVDLFTYNAWRNQFLQWTALPYFRIWNALGFMLIGMAFFRAGILQGNRSVDFYKRMAWISFVVSLPLLIYGILARIGVNSSIGPFLGFIEDLPLQNITFRTGTAIMSFTVLAALHLLYPQVSERLRKAVEPVGRTALSNYVFHSVFFLMLFHVALPSRFDTLDHDTFFILAVIVWGLQLIGSNLWLKRYKQGPLEGVWRRLAGKKQVAQS
ncbi:DUF418 domain-containing protein [Kordiimonas aquimaris]|uniref:DUF418 domain-containing protein n=1 Tax=Kordiimonas aquimaris TaxID=707591 RepID=UPI0021D36C26|nr:DUF418 domain-containing protein [Kordiimonas aquimaris]